MVSEVEAADPGQLLGHDGLGHHVGAGPPVLDRDAQGRQLQFHAGVEGLLREGGVPVGLGGVGGDPVLGEPPERVPELPVGVGQGEGRSVHPAKLPTGSAALAATTLSPGGQGHCPDRPESQDRPTFGPPEQDVSSRGPKLVDNVLT